MIEKRTYISVPYIYRRKSDALRRAITFPSFIPRLPCRFGQRCLHDYVDRAPFDSSTSSMARATSPLSNSLRTSGMKF